MGFLGDCDIVFNVTSGSEKVTLSHSLFHLQQQELCSTVFAHLCEVVDDDNEVYDAKIHEICKLIILEGKVETAIVLKSFRKISEKCRNLVTL